MERTMASAKRELLVQTAERLFYAEGFHATGVDRIVEAAGVVRMTLYNNFRSKNALVAEVLARRHARFVAELNAAVAKAAPGQATWALVDAHCDWLRQHGQHGCILMKAVGEFAAHAPEVRDQALDAKADLRARLADALARDGYRTDGGLVERLFLLLEGANAGVPVLGAETALRHTCDSVQALLTAPADLSGGAHRAPATPETRTEVP
jgi:AcrR family transcriptional regulator